MKNSDEGFCGFGEAYFSSVEPGYVKGWKRHKKMTLNLVVPIGSVQVAVVDSQDYRQNNFLLGITVASSYGRLTVPPGFWVAFGGRNDAVSIMLNLASIPHDPDESETCPLATFQWNWLESA